VDELKQDLLESYKGEEWAQVPTDSLSSGDDGDDDGDGVREGFDTGEPDGMPQVRRVDSDGMPRVQRAQQPTREDRLKQQFDGVYNTALGEVQAQYKDEAGRAVGNGLLLLGFDHNDAWHLNYESTPYQHTDPRTAADERKPLCCCMRCGKAEVDPMQPPGDGRSRSMRWGGCHPCQCCQSDYSLLKSADSVAGRLQVCAVYNVLLTVTYSAFIAHCTDASCCACSTARILKGGSDASVYPRRHAEDQSWGL
jgi:hypothetical protein